MELDGFEYHCSRSAFVYDRVRQNDLAGNLFSLATPAPAVPRPDVGYFDLARGRLDLRPLRVCQREALTALAATLSAAG
ncbi:hypothetical protein [Streptomyces sp. NPDC059063]|uniref:hypothetical protein n=1 Tax=unclassified Streptomyces TaxID=2593676 RepID=UPI0036915D68